MSNKKTKIIFKISPEEKGLFEKFCKEHNKTMTKFLLEKIFLSIHSDKERLKIEYKDVLSYLFGKNQELYLLFQNLIEELDYDKCEHMTDKVRKLISKTS